MGLTPCALRLLVEIEGTEQVAVVGHRDLLHAQRQRPGEQLVEANGAVEQAVLGVKVQVRETGHAAREGLLARCGKVNERDSC